MVGYYRADTVGVRGRVRIIIRVGLRVSIGGAETLCWAIVILLSGLRVRVN